MRHIEHNLKHIADMRMNEFIPIARKVLSAGLCIGALGLAGSSLYHGSNASDIQTQIDRSNSDIKKTELVLLQQRESAEKKSKLQ